MESFNPNYFGELHRLETGHFWFRARNRLILSVARRLVPLPQSILEIGCGTGFVLEGLAAGFPDAWIVGGEYFGEGLAFAADRVPRASFLRLDARCLPFFDRFDLVGAFDVLEHLDDDRGALAGIADALLPGGIALFTVPQHPSLWSETDDVACHVRRYRVGELSEKCADAGLAVVYQTSFVSLLFPVMAVARFARKGVSDDPLQELKIGPLLNGLLGGVMGIERLFIEGGVRFPFGGSALVAARKE